MADPKDDELSREIASGLDAVWRTQGRRFVSFEFDPGPERELWVQYIDGELNLCWPFDTPPEERLGTLPNGAFVMSWQPRGTAILAVGDALQGDLAGFIARTFSDVLGLPRGTLPETRFFER